MQVLLHIQDNFSHSEKAKSIILQRPIGYCWEHLEFLQVIIGESLMGTNYQIITQ